MRKLELKHLAPYLPYGLKVLYTTAEKSSQLIVLGVHDNGGRIRYEGEKDNDPDFTLAVCLKPHHKYRSHGYFYIHKNFKPILRPLSDLTKEIEHNGERFVPIEFGCNGMEDEFKKIMNPTGCCTEYLVISRLRYDAVQKLFEWHFDVFGLINKNLAIDINTLEI